MGLGLVPRFRYGVRVVSLGAVTPATALTVHVPLLAPAAIQQGPPFAAGDGDKVKLTLWVPASLGRGASNVTCTVVDPGDGSDVLANVAVGVFGSSVTGMLLLSVPPPTITTTVSFT